jgi:hypothetical protein
MSPLTLGSLLLYSGTNCRRMPQSNGLRQWLFILCRYLAKLVVGYAQERYVGEDQARTQRWILSRISELANAEELRWSFR